MRYFLIKYDENCKSYVCFFAKSVVFSGTEEALCLNVIYHRMVSIGLRIDEPTTARQHDTNVKCCQERCF
jgi:hypothetical protein